jgi:hypothetical protein
MTSEIEQTILNSISKNQELSCGIETIYRINAWHFLAHYEKPDDGGFMLDKNENIMNIMKELEHDFHGHSGGSMAWTINRLYAIAKHHQPLLRYLRRRNYMLISDGLLPQLPRDVVINIGMFL